MGHNARIPKTRGVIEALEVGHVLSSATDINVDLQGTISDTLGISFFNIGGN